MTKYAANTVETFHLMDISCVAMLVAEHRKLLEDYNILLKDKDTLAQNNRAAYEAQNNDDRWRNAVLDKLADYGMDVPLSTLPKEILNQIIQEAILMSKDLLINKVNVTYETVEDNNLVGHCSAPIKHIRQEDDGSFTIVLDGWPNNAKFNHGKYIQQFAPEVFVVFDPQTDGYHIIGAARTLSEAEDMLLNYVNYEANAVAAEETVESYYGEVKVPKGYTAEELERDNPYNQWMYE